MKSKDQTILEIIDLKQQKNQTIWLTERTLGPKLKNHTVNLLEITESICCFYGYLLKRKKSES